MTLTVVKNKSTRLPQTDIDDLEFFWQAFESTIQVKSSFSSQLNALVSGCGQAGSSEGPPWSDPYTSSMLKSIGRARAIRNKLLRMVEKGDNTGVTVLYKVYSGAKKHPPFGVFGDLASIVELTRPAEIQARKLAKSPREAIELRMREPDSGPFAKSLIIAAERLLALASKSYLEGVQ